MRCSSAASRGCCCPGWRTPSGICTPIVRWAILLAALAIVSGSGTTLAAAFLFYGLKIYGTPSFVEVLLEANRNSLPISMVVGSVMIVLESRKHQLHATELALRTQQLERERAEKLAAAAQLASLTARVEPHFLFNTLNSISALIRQDPREAERMIERLSSLLRASLDSGGVVPLERECER